MLVKKLLAFHGNQNSIPGLHQSSDHIDKTILHSVSYLYETILIISSLIYVLPTYFHIITFFYYNF